MTLLRYVLLATAPAIFWLWFYYRSDRWDPEPKVLVFKLFLCGALVAAPAWFLQGILPGPDGALYDNFVRVALLEEAFKVAPLLWFALRRREFDEPMDGIVYAVAVALGFATVENVIYAIHLGDRAILFRAFTATPAHVGFSGLAGYAAGMAVLRRHRWSHFVAAFLAVVALHGAYDLILSLGARQASDWIARMTVVVLVPTLLLLLWWATRLADRASPFRPRSESVE
jgi:RsiW-degrading membrane proteinase PrsW (M82 family)